MPSDPFVILGIQKGASQSEILEAYKTKRAYYQQHVFDEGEAGADAARMLEVLDTAYQDAMSYTHEHAEVGGEGGENSYDAVKEAISDKDFAKVQSLLDDMYYRGGEWHYYQAIVFYEKNWLNESKKQLELAVDLDPENEKYKRSLENMKKKIDGTNAFKQQSGGQSGEQNGQNYRTDGGQDFYATQRSYQQDPAASAADGCCTACQCAICADCCCECLGGDLIRCC